jgi:hypothetical protein
MKVILLSLLLACPRCGDAITLGPPVRTTHYYYVAPSGSDSNPGTRVAPFRTVQHAADIVNPGDTVIVNDGVYTGLRGSTTIVRLNRGGTSNAWITFKSANKWGAKLDGQNFDRDGFSIGVDPAYLRIQNFEIYGTAGGASSWATGISADGAGSYIDIVGNNIHDIGKICTDTTKGQDGIFLNTHNVTIEQNLIHDIGRLAPGENGCQPTTGYYMNHDHGIYVYGGNHYLIQNNIFHHDARGWSIQLYPNALDNVTIANNTFADPNPYRDGFIIVGATITNSFITNNLFYQPTTAAIDFDIVAGADGLTVANNLSTGGIYSYATTPTGVIYTSNLEKQAASTLMVDPTNHNYHLKAGSPAIGAGTATKAPGTDFDGVARATPPSIGTYDRGH